MNYKTISILQELSFFKLPGDDSSLVVFALPKHTGRPQDFNLTIKVQLGNEQLPRLFELMINHPIMQTLDLQDKGSPNQKFSTRVHTENQMLMTMTVINRDYQSFLRCPFVVKASNLSEQSFNILSTMAGNFSREIKRAMLVLEAWHDVGKSEYNRLTLAPTSDANDHCVVGKSIINHAYCEMDIPAQLDITPETTEIVRDALPYHAAPGMMLQGEASGQMLDLVIHSMKKHPRWKEEILDLYHVHSAVDVISAIPGFLHQNVIDLNTHLFMYLRPHILHAASLPREEASGFIEQKFMDYVKEEMAPFKDAILDGRDFEDFRMLRLFRFYWTDHKKEERALFIKTYNRVIEDIFASAPTAKASYIELMNRYRNGFELWYLPALAATMADKSGAFAKGRIADEAKFAEMLKHFISLTYHSLLIRDQNDITTEGIYKSVNFAKVNAPLQSGKVDYTTFISYLQDVVVNESFVPSPDKTIQIGKVKFESEQHGVSYAPVLDMK